MNKITNKTIDEATVLVIDIIAEVVAEKTIYTMHKEELDSWKKINNQEKMKLESKIKEEKNALEDYLILRANTCFQYNKVFNRNIKRKNTAGRDYLYLFMYHWAGWYEDKLVASYKKSMDNYYQQVDSKPSVN